MSKVILFRGKAGTGKTTLSNALGKQMNLAVIHKDDIYDSIALYVSEHDTRNKICFDILYRLLQSSLSSQAAIIIDFGFNDLKDAIRFQRWIEEHGGVLVSISCICSDESIWEQRLQERKRNPLPNQRITEVSALQEHYKKLDTRTLEGELVLDTVGELEVLIGKMCSISSFATGKYTILKDLAMILTPQRFHKFFMGTSGRIVGFFNLCYS